jgi:single-strand DNA-binding protein
MNVINIVGRLGNDPDIHEFDDGNAITNLSVATSERYKNPKTEEWVEQTTWHRVTVRGGQAKPCAQYLAKGSQVAVTGAYISRQYEKDGETRTAYEIKAQRVEFLGSKGDNAEQGQPSAGNSNASESVPF